MHAREPICTHYGVRVRGVILPASIPTADTVRVCVCLVSDGAVDETGRVVCRECRYPWSRRLRVQPAV